MRDVLPLLHERWRRGETVALATVVGAYRSAPRPVGSSMLVTADGTISGSVSGGCVEGAVYELAQAAIGGAPPTVETFGIADEQAFAVGLTCGGVIDVLVEAMSPGSFVELPELAESVAAGEPVALATVVADDDGRRVGRRVVVRATDVVGSTGLDRIDAAVVDDARGLLAHGHNAVVTYGPQGERRGEGLKVFVATFAPRPRLIVFGATDVAAALVEQAALLGHDVTVCDARAVFAVAERFPRAEHVVVAQPHRYLADQVAAGAVDGRTVLCVLTHDPKFDVPLLAVALRLEGVARPAFVGVMGSRRTHADRQERLRREGLGEEELARLSSPVGLDLGGRTPAETALSIMAEVVAARWGGSGLRLGEVEGRIHHDQVADSAAQAREWAEALLSGPGAAGTI